MDTKEWPSCQKSIYSEIKEISKDIKELNGTLVDVRLDLERLKTKSAVWGATAAIVVTAILEAIFGRL